METEEFRRMRKLFFEVGFDFREACKVLGDVLSNASRTFRDVYLSLLPTEQRKKFFKKERHRQKYYRMMERRQARHGKT